MAFANRAKCSMTVWLFVSLRKRHNESMKPVLLKVDPRKPNFLIRILPSKMRCRRVRASAFFGLWVDVANLKLRAVAFTSVLTVVAKTRDV